jgi:SpoVK/Ycf46/Vps4 family AAA+-type ATPase
MPIKRRDKFVEYLDLHKRAPEFPYNNLVNVINATHSNFINNKLYESAYSGSDVFHTPPNPYESWLFQHEFRIPEITDNEVAQLLLNISNKIDPGFVKKEPLVNQEVIIKEKKHIESSVNSFKDILKIVNEHEYDSKFEYNIDLKALVSVKDELLELDSMIGMSSFKNAVLDQLLYFIQNLHIGKESDFKNTILCGPPGTGKTEAAKILGKMYSKIGILKNAIFKKVTRSDLVAGYLGQTAIKTKKVVTECLGGCLFIDEAYSLANGPNDDSYSKECLDTLCEAMSDHKEDLMVIIAGYEEELYRTFFQGNRGLESRFIWRFNIEEYSPIELMQIFLKKVAENDWRYENVDGLEKWFESKKESFKNYGRDMELLFTYTKIAHGRRIYGKSEETRKNLCIDDLNAGYKSLLANSKKKDERPIIYGLYT